MQQQQTLQKMFGWLTLGLTRRRYSDSPAMVRMRTRSGEFVKSVKIHAQIIGGRAYTVKPAVSRGMFLVHWPKGAHAVRLRLEADEGSRYELELRADRPDPQRVFEIQLA